MKQSHTKIADIVEQGRQLLSSISDSAKLDTQILVAHVLDKSMSYLFTWPEKLLTSTQLKQITDLLERRNMGEPIAYIIGIKEFWSLPFYVSEATLIPRPDTETLVEQVLLLFNKTLPLFIAEDPETAVINCLDLGTGTGAIALALASEMPHWHIEAIDFSQEAVLLAQKNAKNLALSQVKIYQSDWFSQVEKNQQFNIIVSNPPYIDENDPHLNEGDVRFEPKTALIAKQKGLADFENIAKQARDYLTVKGMLVLEHGFEQKAALHNILTELAYKNITTVKDLSGNDRITWAFLS